MEPQKSILLWLLLAAMIGSFPGHAQEWVAGSHLKVRLISENVSLQPGKTNWVGFDFKIDPGWHIYWENPGDAGQPPHVSWALPKGVRAGAFQWPAPEKLPAPSLMDFGYTQEVLLAVPIHVPTNYKGKRLSLKADLQWLVCRDVCLPGEAKLRMDLAVSKSPAPKSLDAGSFRQTQDRLPLPQPAVWKTWGTLGKDSIRLFFRTGESPDQAYFFPMDPNQVDNLSAQKLDKEGDSYTLILKRSDQLSSPLPSIRGVLETMDGRGPPKAYSVEINLTQGG